MKKIRAFSLSNTNIKGLKLKKLQKLKHLLHFRCEKSQIDVKDLERYTEIMNEVDSWNFGDGG